MPGRRSSRAAAKKAAAALESNPPKNVVEAEDEPMPDAGAMDVVPDIEVPEQAPERGELGDEGGVEAREEDDDVDNNNNETENGNDEDDEVENEAQTREPTGDGEEGEDDDGDEDDDDGEGETTGKEGGSTRHPTPPPQPIVRRKRLGRPPKNKPPDWDPMVTVTDETPRRRGRGGWKGRGGRKGGPAATKAEQVIDADGNVAEIVDDECLLPEDAEGETKVDKLGNLEDGREYRCRTFTVLGRGKRLYMLSTEPARCVGFRDSYLFFTKHRKLYKIIVDDDEKRDMIERNIIPHSYKGRSIGIVTARSVFREFGARIIVGGKRIVDDYNVAQARDEGAVEGQLADPEDRFIPGEPYNKNQYVAWHGASAVYHTSTPSAPVPSGGRTEYKKRKVNVNDTNWMLEHAREARAADNGSGDSIFSSGIGAVRRLNNDGVYDIHTNTMMYPATMQPTLARIEQLASPSSADGRLPPVTAKMARNLLIIDTYMESPPAGSAPTALDKPPPVDFLAAFHGLGAVSDEIKDLLPDTCRAALEASLAQDREWKAAWGLERDKTSRRQPIIDKAIVPYSMT